MLVKLWVSLLVTSVAIFAAGDVQNAEAEWQQWHWNCNLGQCIRSKGPPLDVLQQSPATCRLACSYHGSLWPRPTGSTYLSRAVQELNPSNINWDMVDVADEAKNLMDEMTSLFIENLKMECGKNCIRPTGTSLKIRFYIVSGLTTIDWATDESYALLLNTTENFMQVRIDAATIFGARHALETLSQLTTRYDSPDGSSLLILSSARVMDRPAYPHRGLMLDTARHFLSLKSIKRSLDGMAASKMNVLHWHATDSQSFPLVSPRVPQLARYGAYSESEMYRATDIADLMKYAKVRGIRVIIELDAPAHAGAGWQWGEEAGLGALVVCWAHQNWRERCIQPPCGQLNPANPQLFRVLGELYKDLAEWMSKGEFFHMGGDEVFMVWSLDMFKDIKDLLQTYGGYIKFTK